MQPALQLLLRNRKRGAYAPGGSWYESASYSSLAAVMDFNNDRYSLPALGDELIADGTFATAPTYGSELVVNGAMTTTPSVGSNIIGNGTFDDTSVWLSTGPWGTISGGVASYVSMPNNSEQHTQPVTLTDNALYEVTLTISGWSSGAIRPRFTGGGTQGNWGTANANGTWRMYIESGVGNTTFGLQASGTTTLSVDNITVKLVTGNVGWRIGEVAAAVVSFTGGALSILGNGTTNQAFADQVFDTTIGAIYELTMTVGGTGTVGISVGTSISNNANLATTLTGGTFTWRFTATATRAYLRVRKDAATTSTIDDVSVKEVTNVAAQMLTAPIVSGANPRADIINGRLRLTNTAAANVQATYWVPVIAGSVYQISFTQYGRNGGASASQYGVTQDPSTTLLATVTPTAPGAGLSTTIINAFTATVTGSAQIRFFPGSTTSGDYAEWDNISVKEVILHPGSRSLGANTVVNPTFSVAPVLGSELVVDGAMTTPANWSGTGWTISGGVATHAASNTSSLNPTTTIVPVADVELYRTSYDITAVTTAGNGVSAQIGGSQGGIRSAVATGVGDYLRPGSAAVFGISPRGVGSFEGALDNISCKKVTNYAAFAWTPGADADIVGGKLVKSAGTSSSILLTQYLTIEEGAVYEVAWTLDSISTGSITPSFQGGTTVNGNSRSIAGPYKEYIVGGAGNTVLRFTASSTGVNATISSVSLKKLTTTTTRTYGSELVVNGDFATAPTYGAELISEPSFDAIGSWVPSVDATITGGQLVKSGTTIGTLATHTVTLTPGSVYEITADFAAMAGSGINIQFTGGTSVTITNPGNAAGVRKAWLQAVTGNNNINIQGNNATTTGTLNSFSVKEVTNAVALGWKLLQNAPGSSVAAPDDGSVTISGGTLNLTGDGTNSAYADQSFTTVASQVYEVTFTVGATNAAGLFLGTTQGNNNVLASPATGYAASTTHTIKFVATGTTTWARFSRTSTGTCTVDNVSIRALTAIGTYPKRTATFDECFAYTAASTTARTYTDNAGLLKNDLAVNARRMTYANGKRQLRLENAGTNAITYSDTLTDVQYTNDNVTVTSIANDWWSYRETTANSFHRLVRGTGSVVASTTYTLSALVRKAGRRYLFARTDLLVQATSRQVGFDLDTLTVPYASAGLTGAIRQVGTDMFLLSVTGTTDATTAARTIGFGSANASVASDTIPSFVGDVAQGFDIRYVQLEANAFATDHIRTTTAAVTRAIETARLSPLLEAVLQRAQGSVVTRLTLTNTDTSVSRRIVGGDATTALVMLGSASAVNIQIWNGTNSITGALPSGSAYSAFGTASGFDAAGRSIVSNGGTVGTDANAPGGRTNVYLGRDTSNAAKTFGDGYYDLLGVSPERLPNTDLQTLAVAAT